MKTIYLDYAAATPMDRKVVAAMQPYFSQKFHNPSSIYLTGRAAHQALEEARAAVAQNLGAKPADIIFTAGATEANNLAMQGVMKNFHGGEVLVSAIEHESVLAQAALFNCRMAAVGPKGRPLYLHSDCAQAPNYFDMHVARLGVDLLTVNGGKIYGPKQSGALYIRAGVQLQP